MLVQRVEKILMKENASWTQATLTPAKTTSSNAPTPAPQDNENAPLPAGKDTIIK
jgi:hypothetical protein